jgi:uncharacterized membrane protein
MPNAAYLHLLLNHFPIIVNVTGVLVILAAIAWRSDAVVRAGLLLLVIAALFCVPTFMTGDGAADVVRHMDGVDAAAIKPHNQSAGYTLTLLSIEGVAALAAWIFYRRPKELPRWAVMTLLAFSIIASAHATYTAMLGGRIHHPETHMKQG